MIYSITGEILGRTDEGVVIDHGGLGILVLVPLSDLAVMPAKGQQITLYTHFHVKEDGMTLYGFRTMKAKEVFELLITVNGIGPKGGLAIMSTLSVDDICFAVMSEDSKTISRAPGIGPKTAKKMIVELKDRLSADMTATGFEDIAVTGEAAGDPKNQAGEAEDLSQIRSDVTEALVALGYTSTDAMKAVRKLDIKEGMTESECVMEALKIIA